MRDSLLDLGDMLYSIGSGNQRLITHALGLARAGC